MKGGVYTSPFFVLENFSNRRKKLMKNDRIKLFFLKNGVQLVAEMSDTQESDKYFVKNPYRVAPQMDEKTNQIYYYIHPHLPLIDEGQDIDIAISDLLHAPKTPNASVIDLYLQHTSNLILPNVQDKKSLLHG